MLPSNIKDSSIYDTFDQSIKSPYYPDEKTYSRSDVDKQNYPYYQYENMYPVESLYETWISKLHIIDKELSSEFAVRFHSLDSSFVPFIYYVLFEFRRLSIRYT